MLATAVATGYREANKAQAAEFFQVSVNTIDAWLRRGAPVVERGAAGRPWKIDLWRMAQWRLQASGAGDGDAAPERMTPQDRKAWYESEIKRRDLQRLDGELVPVEDVERVIATAFAAIAQELRALPDNLERRFGVPGDVAERVEEGVFRVMDELADRLSVLAPVESGE